MKENFLNKIPLKLYRDFRNFCNCRKVFCKTKKDFGKEYALIQYKADRAIFRYGVSDKTYKYLSRKDNYILSFVEEKCRDVINKYSDMPACIHYKSNSDGNIWVFWWQGEETAPDIVKLCINSIRKNSNGHDVVLLSQNNYLDYVDIPQLIIDKHEKGIIKHAFFADIVRCSLLSKFGGAWIDATVYLSQPIPQYIFERDFFTAKSINEQALYFSKSRWVGYFLVGSKNFQLFSFVKEMLAAYLEQVSSPIDYLLMDYVFDIACRYIPQVKAEIDAVKDNNLIRGRLMNEINLKYNESLFEELCTGETFISKLSYRYGNPVPFDSFGELTNYGYLLTLQ